MTVRTRTKRKFGTMLRRIPKKTPIKRGFVRSERKAESPLDVRGVDLAVTTREIVQFIHEGRGKFQKEQALESGT